MAEPQQNPLSGKVHGRKQIVRGLLLSLTAMAGIAFTFAFLTEFYRDQPPQDALQAVLDRLVPSKRTFQVAALSANQQNESQPSEPVVYGPGNILLFYDPKFPPDPGTGTDALPAINKVAFVTSDYGALFAEDGIVGQRIVKIERDQIPKLLNLSSRAALPDHSKLIAGFLERYATHPAYFAAGVAALYFQNPDVFIRGKLYPELPRYNDISEREKAWSDFVSRLQPMDAILTINTSSLISRFIAWGTHGPWSHTAMYLGNGEIGERVTSGHRRVPIEAYKGPEFHLAAYRRMEDFKSPPTREFSLKFDDDVSEPPGYDYFGAIEAGWHAFLGEHHTALIPNDIMYVGHAALIAVY